MYLSLALYGKSLLTPAIEILIFIHSSLKLKMCFVSQTILGFQMLLLYPLSLCKCVCVCVCVCVRESKQTYTLIHFILPPHFFLDNQEVWAASTSESTLFAFHGHKKWSSLKREPKLKSKNNHLFLFHAAYSGPAPRSWGLEHMLQLFS